MGYAASSPISRFTRLTVAAATAALLGACALGAAQPALAQPTSAEKQAEANVILAQLDQQQTAMNEANVNYIRASAEYDAAVAAVDEAQRKVDEESAHIAELQDALGACAVNLYKMDGGNSYLSFLLDSESFEELEYNMDAIEALSQSDAALVEEARAARETYEAALASLQQQSERAAAQMELARQSQEEAAAMHDALVTEATRITAEVAALQAQEEVLAEEARKAEEARAAAEEEAQRQLQALADAGQETRQLQEEKDAEIEQLAARAETAEALAEAATAATDTAEAQAEEMGIDTAASVDYSLLQNPCPEAYNASGFGYRDFDKSFHKGLDMAAAEGTPYYAAEAGTVIHVTNDGGYNGGAGNWIVITHGNGLVTKYMHSSQTLVNVGDQVQRGQLIGLVGNTGDSHGAHLHFQVEMNGDAINPLSFIDVPNAE